MSLKEHRRFTVINDCTFANNRKCLCKLQVEEAPTTSSGSVRSLNCETRSGKILAIKLKNFMCHRNLTVDFNQRTNLIVGRNGSGKSAILTALIIGLGAKANATDRSSNIKREYWTPKVVISSYIFNNRMCNFGRAHPSRRELMHHRSASVQRWWWSIREREIRWPHYRVTACVQQRWFHVQNEKPMGPCDFDQPNRIVTYDFVHEHPGGQSGVRSNAGCLTWISARVSNLLVVYDDSRSNWNNLQSQTISFSSNPAKRFELFLRATQMDVILHSVETCHKESLKFREELKYHEKLAEENKKEMEKAKEKFAQFQSMEVMKVWHSQSIY